MKAVNLPGSLYFSAQVVIALPHGPGDRLVALQGILPLDHVFTPEVIGLPALAALYEVMDLCGRTPSSADPGFDSAIIGARPRFSEWSDTTRKS